MSGKNHERDLSPRGKRSFYLAGIACVTVCSLLAVTPAVATLHRGEGYLGLNQGGWDFSAFSYVTGPDLINADVFLAVMAYGSDDYLQPTTYFLSGSGLQYAPTGVDFDSLAVAPESGYTDTVLAYQWGCYFVRTKEGHYAKMQLYDFGPYPWVFRYAYQDDGTTTVPVVQSTWGKLKELYRSE